MIGNCDYDEIKKQMQFCMNLVMRLNDEINSSEGREGYWSGLENHCRMQDDIKRIRRELMTVSKMLNPWK